MAKLINRCGALPIYGTPDHERHDALLPKCFFNWCAVAGFRMELVGTTGYGRSRLSVNRKGCLDPVRRLRAMPHIGIMQICDGSFDRWANSVGGQVALPKTKEEFAVAIKYLLENAQVCAFDVDETLKGLRRDLNNADQHLQVFNNEYADVFGYVEAHGMPSDAGLRRMVCKALTRRSGLVQARRAIVKNIKAVQCLPTA